jgi:hypothetical protein
VWLGFGLGFGDFKAAGAHAHSGHSGMGVTNDAWAVDDIGI